MVPIPHFCNNKWGTGFSPKLITQLTVESDLLLLSLNRDARSEGEDCFYLASAELQALYSEVSSTKRLPHLEWDLIGQFFKTVWTALQHQIKSRRLSPLVLPVPHHIPLTSAGISQGGDMGQLYCWGQNQPQVSHCKSKVEPSGEEHGLITQVFTL